MEIYSNEFTAVLAKKQKGSVANLSNGYNISKISYL